MMDYLIHTEHFNILAKVQGMLLLILNLFKKEISKFNSSLKVKKTTRGENVVFVLLSLDR